MHYLLIRHEVEDFDRWKPIFLAHRGVREAAGLHDVHLFRDADHPDYVTALFSVDDLARAKAFGESIELRDTMRAAGVLGTPEFRILNEA